MPEIMISDIDEVLLDRIGRVAARCGWDLSSAMAHLLEQGLLACESGARVRLEGGEDEALRAALEALSRVPDDPGFAMIGRAGAAGGN